MSSNKFLGKRIQHQRTNLRQVETSVAINGEESGSGSNYNNRISNNGTINTYEGNLDGDYWLNDLDDDTIKSDSVKREKICCCFTKITLIWISIILLIFVSIYAIVDSIFYQKCNRLNEKFGSIKPETISYDPNIYNNFKIEDFNNVMEGEIIVSRSNKSNINATLSIRLATIKEFDSFTKSEFQNSTFNLQILRKSFLNSNGLGWLGYLSIPPKCIAARLELTLPNFTSSKIDSKKFDIKFKSDSNSYSNQIHLETTSGGITLENGNKSLTNQLLIVTNTGNVSGNIKQSIQSELSITTNSGFVNLNLGVMKILNNNNNNNNNNNLQSQVKVITSKGNVNFDINIEQGIKSPNVDIRSVSSDIFTRFNGLFNGRYDIDSSTGRINIENNRELISVTSGNVGDFNNETLIGMINIKSNSGDINVKF